MLEDVNLPLFAQELPEHHFEDDFEDMLRVYRSREMQFIGLLGENLTMKRSPFVKLNNGLTMKENIDLIKEKDRLDSFFEEYRQHLTHVQRIFDHEVKVILGNQWYTISLSALVTVCILLAAFLLYKLSRLLIKKNYQIREMIWLALGLVQFLIFNTICFFL